MLGILGGLGPAASCYLYQMLIDHTPASCDQDHIDIVISSRASTPDRTAFIIMAADAISAARPGARRENMESYIKRLETLEALCNGFEGVESSYAVQAGREVRILVQPDKVSDDQVILLARNVAKKIENELDYPGQIKVSVIRESRATEYAK